MMIDEMGSLEGLSRSISFYSLGVPTYLRYRYLQQFHNSDEDRWQALHSEAAAAGLEKIKELRGFYIKTGQMCATNVGNAFPLMWQRTMSVLQDGVPGKPMDVVKETVEEGLGKKMDEVFESFDPEPIGAASIGQVHRAVLKSGQKVVVKVQYPEVERLFRGDVRTLILFCKVAQPVHVPALEEIEKQFMTEFDYREECRKLMTVRGNLIKGGWVPRRCEVPEPLPELSSKNVLVMEELDGTKLVDALNADAERYAATLGKTLEEFLREEEMSTLKNGERRGPKKEIMDAYIAVQNAKRRTENLAGLAKNAMWFWWPGYEKRKWVGKETLPINHGRMVDELIDVHGHEIFVDGYFNADPHPGNMLLLDQKTGSPRIGLIDYGQVKELTRENIVILSKMMVALQEDDEPEMARLIFEAGYKTKGMRPDLAAKYARVSLDEDNKSVCNGKHVQVFMEELEAQDPVVDLPREFVMVGRVSLMLRGLGHSLKQPRRLSDHWIKYARAVLKEEEKRRGGGAK